MGRGTERNQGGALWSDVFDAACTASGQSEQDLADALDCNRKAIRRWRDSKVAATPRLADVANLPAPALRVVLEALAARLDCAVVPLPPAASVQGHVRTCGAVAKEAGEVVSVLGEALSDGYLQAHEAVQVRAEVREAVGVLLGLDEQLSAVERERVVGVTV